MESLYDIDEPRKPWRIISAIALAVACVGFAVSFMLSRGGSHVINGRWLRMDTAINTSFEKNSEDMPEAFKSLPPIVIPNLSLSRSLGSAARPHKTSATEVAATPGSQKIAAAGGPVTSSAGVEEESDSVTIDQLASEASAASIAASSIPAPALAPPPPAVANAPPSAPINQSGPSPPISEPPAQAAATLQPAAPTPSVATQTTSESVATAPDNEVALASPPSDTQSFFQLLSRHLTAANDRALAESLHAGDKEVIEIRFTIDRNGRVLHAVAGTSSGNPVLDQSAARVVLNASPLPKPPPGLPGNKIELSFAVEVYR